MRIMYEKEIEAVLAKYPQLIEEGLLLEGRQVSIHGRWMDLVFKDALGRILIVELKAVTLKDEHIGQIMAYEGSMLATSGSNLRIMLIGTKVPNNFRASLDHHKIEWREITPTSIINFLNKMGDESLLSKRKCDIDALLKSPDNPVSNKAALQLSAFSKKQYDYWKGFRNFIEDKGLAWKLPKPLGKNYYYVKMPQSKYQICLSLNSPGNKDPFICASFWIPSSKDTFNYLLTKKASIEKEMGRPLFWDEKPGKKASSIWVTMAMDYSNEKNWVDSYIWFVGRAPMLSDVCNRYLM